MVLNFNKNEYNHPRFGWTLPRYVGKAVIRNRIKRWCREISRDVINDVHGGNLSFVDINIVLKRQSRNFYKSIKYDEFKKILQPTLQKIIKNR